MVDLLVEHGTVITVNETGQIIRDGAVAVENGELTHVGNTEAVRESVDADTIIDASGKALLPGFVISHAHVSDILFRGGVSNERSIYDWLYNVKKPGIHAMGPEDHAVASALYAWEALRYGITTFVELPDPVFLGGDHDVEAIVDAKLTEYEHAGIRNGIVQIS